jgi:hypothetical protein
MVKIILKDGEYFNKSLGYVISYDKNKRMCVPKHRLIMEQRLGRRLSRDELVHHIDNNKLNNAPSNLRVESRHNHNIRRHKHENNFYGKNNPSKHMTAQHHASLKAAWVRRKKIYGATGAKEPSNLRRKGYEANLKRKNYESNKSN